ncbi:MAG: secondary thiamine-phosphate synthase enzyme YjbQ [Nitrospinae bacterium]|nr:secondary thiamine-phosphate synthase enzyme YjbQ [Nitrospinota bacterium]MCG2813836.1 secondary thiamine-phosphate synthase enzyme YjbQ [Thermodesulfovibrionales bacterium]
MLRYINVRSSQRSEFIDITEKINEVIKETGILSGICYVYVPHTTAAVTINEGADPSVHRDIQNALTRLVPQEMNYSHREGNADAHIKSSIIGTSQLVIIDEGRLVLGTWQAVYFCEFDGPRHRRATLKLIADK